MDLSVGPLDESEWEACRAVAHRAFLDEPFTVEMFGEPILDRWGGSWGLYSSLGSATSTLAFAARVDEVLVGVVLGSAAGQCSMCEVYAHEARPDDPHLAIDWQFHQNIAEVHRSLDEHAWIDKLAVEPALRGLGIGRRLLVAAADALTGGEPTELVLECAPDRVGFYSGVGFEQVSTFADPAGPDASLMRRRIY
jgi:ribosomal protein S18 acetylase RimI-like enzyme